MNIDCKAPFNGANFLNLRIKKLIQQLGNYLRLIENGKLALLPQNTDAFSSYFQKFEEFVEQLSSNPFF